MTTAELRWEAINALEKSNQNTNKVLDNKLNAKQTDILLKASVNQIAVAQVLATLYAAEVGIKKSGPSLI